MQRPTHVRPGFVSRYVLPVVLFVAIIGGIAWLTQNMANWREPDSATPLTPAMTETSTAILQFNHTRAVWDLEDFDYVREFERGVEGHYDFPFRNVLGKPAEMGLSRVSCDCTYADVAFLPAEEWQRIAAELDKNPAADVQFSQEPTWHKITQSETEGIKVPADVHGLVRISWKGRKDTGEHLRINLRFWAQPEGVLTRQFTDIHVPVVMAHVVQFDPVRENVGGIGPGDTITTQFHLWSATRDADTLNLRVDSPADNPLFVVEARQLSEHDCKRLQERLREKKIYTKVRVAYLVTATVHEEKDGKQMDQGPFRLTIPLYVDELPAEHTPMVAGSVKGHVDVGGLEDQGKIQLGSFRASEGVPRKVVPVWTRPEFELETHDQFPSALEVKLRRNEKGSTSSKARWDLEVKVPPNGWTGPFPEDSVIILRIPGDPPRLIRIPVVGHGVLSGQG